MRVPTFVMASAALAVLLAGCAPKPPRPDVAEQLARYDAEIARAQEDVRKFSDTLPADTKDFRGRTPRDDLDRWVLPQKTRDEMAKLRELAAAADSVAEATIQLDKARALVGADLRRGVDIANYWSHHLPAPYWRRYWEALFKSNGVDAEEPDPLLVSIEKTVAAALEKGEFVQAGNDADILAAALEESLNRASGRVYKVRQPMVDFSPRQTPCVRGAPPDPNRRTPKLAQAESVETFYPAEAIKRGETGSVFLQTRVDGKGCAREVAIRVRSGVDSLDAAALQWFESAQFSPASADGRAIDADLTFKVRFVLQDSATPK